MYSDEDLNALLDGEMDLVEAKMLRMALVEDAALADRFEQLAMADSIVKSTYQEIDAEPLPKALNTLLDSQATQSGNQAAHSSNVVSIKKPIWGQRPLQMAAAVVLGVGVYLGTSPLRHTPVDLYAQATTVGPIEAESGLAAVLNQRTSAVSYSLRDDGAKSAVAVKPILSFKSSMGEWCREFTVTSYTDSARTLACRQGEQWQIVLASNENKSAQAGEYATASTVSSTEFDARIDSLIEGEPLSAEQEAALINKSWSSNALVE